eukprot:jgi/Bigna1/88528/estExt_fgenesh1_pg.C_330101
MATAEEIAEGKLSDNMAAIAHSVAGGLSGIISQAILFPLETLKYQQQAAGSCRKKYRMKKERENSMDDSLNDVMDGIEKGKPDENGAFNEIQPAQWSDLLTPEFYKTCYAGLGISLCETGCFHGIHFYFYTLFKKLWMRRNGGAQMSPSVALAVGSLAGLLVQLITSPLKVLQINSVLLKDETTLQIAQRIYKKKGLQGFWRGFGVNTILVLNPAITFLVYERIRKSLHRMGYSSALVDFCCGFVGKVVASLITYPAMLLKTKLLTGEAEKLGGLIEICKKITKEEGFLGWFEGLGAKLAQTTLTSSFVFMFKEQLLKLT